MFPLLGFEPGELVAVRQCHQTCCRRRSAADRQLAMAVPTGLLRVSDVSPSCFLFSSEQIRHCHQEK